MPATPAPDASPATALLLDPVFQKHLTGDGHPECPGRYAAITRELQTSGLLAELAQIEVRDVADDEILLCHTPDYLAKIKFEIPVCLRCL